MRGERRSPVTRIVRSPDGPTTVNALVCGCSRGAAITVTPAAASTCRLASPKPSPLSAV